MTRFVPWTRLLAGAISLMLARTGLAGRQVVALQPVPVPVRVPSRRG